MGFQRTEIVPMVGAYRLVACDGAVKIDLNEADTQDLTLSILKQIGVDIETLNPDTRNWLNQRVRQIELGMN